MSKKYEVRAVSLVDMMWKILFAWKKICVCALILTVLACCYSSIQYRSNLAKYEQDIQDFNSETVNSTSANVTVQDYYNNLTDAEQKQVQSALFYKSIENDMAEYVENSVLMTVNPYNEKQLVMNYYVDTDYVFNTMTDNELPYTDALVTAYESYVSDGILAKSIAEQSGLGIEELYIQECLSIKKSSHSTSFTSEDGTSLVITMICNDTFDTSKLVQIIKSELEKQSAKLNELYGSHKLNFVSQEVVTVADIDTASIQANTINSLNGYCTQYNNIISSMTDDQKKVLDISNEKQLGDDMAYDVSSEVVEPVRPTFNIKIVFIGFVAGILLMCIWITLLEIFDNHLHHDFELRKFWDLVVISSIRDKKIYKGLDKFFMNMKNRNVKKMDYATSLAMTGSNLALMCKKEGITSLCITGTEIEKLEDASKIVEMLAKEGIIATVCNNVCYDMNALKKVAEIGTVVLLEAEGISIYCEIDRQLEVLQQNQVKIIGAVAVE